VSKLHTELAKRSTIRRLARENYEVNASKVAKDVEPHQFAHLTLEAIPFDYGPASLRNQNCGPWMCERGNDCPDLKGLCPNALPLSKNGCKLRLTRQAVSP
jgi:hypothetical protein